MGTNVAGENPFIPLVKESNWLESVLIITEKPNVTIARYHAFNRTQANPISSPIPAEINPPTRSTTTRMVTDKAPTGIEETPAAFASAVEIEVPNNAAEKPPIPKNAA